LLCGSLRKNKFYNQPPEQSGGFIFYGSKEISNRGNVLDCWIIGAGIYKPH
jgi:hypothetical protein